MNASRCQEPSGRCLPTSGSGGFIPPNEQRASDQR
jgi:hypothetical protein